MPGIAGSDDTGWLHEPDPLLVLVVSGFLVVSGILARLLLVLAVALPLVGWACVALLCGPATRRDS